MISIKALMNELNAREFRCFPQKDDKGKFSLSIKGDKANERFFLTNSVASELNDDGTAQYTWSRGKQMVKQVSNESETDTQAPF